MGFIDKYPYTDFHNLNLDWILARVRELASQMEGWQAANTISYAGTWDITKAYQAWNIVVNDNEGYISKKPVPAGVALTNTEYWELIADYSAIVADLGNRVSDLEDDVESLQLDVTNIGNDLLDAQAALRDNGLTAGNLSVWIGDSYTSAGSLGPDVDKRFSTLVCNTLGLVEHNYSVGGMGFYHGSTPYPVQVANAIVDFNNHDYDFDAVKYVFIVGNRNDTDDSLSYNDYATPVRNTITTAHAAFPNAKIILIPGLWDWKCAPQLLLRYSQIVNQVAQRYQYCQIINNGWQWLTGYASDILWQSGADVHPDTIGHEIIANHIICAMSGRDYQPVFQYELEPTTTHANISSCKMYIQVANGQVHFRCRFKVSDADTTGELWRFTFNSLNLPGIFIMNNSDSLYIEGHSNSGTQTNLPKVHIVQNTTKTDTTTGSMYLNAYCYDGGGRWATGSSDWNELEFSIPYGVRFALF